MRTSMSAGRRLGAAALATVALAGTTLLTATPASALTYKCSTSTKTVDHAGYSGPWADNYTFKVSLCSARSGSTVYAYAKVSWDGPVMAIGDTGTFNDAYLRVFIAKSVYGTDPVVKNGYYHGIEYKLEHSNSYGNGSYTSGTISYPVGSAKAYADGQLRLDWRNDGAGYQTHNFTASPLV
ncbi:hypothetical protein ACF08N_33820 [Streptomyces sp. NPDC015127]|uniref:hypothetical protein n=1 Tax=Streptomyces sp. NPDC015127 TaxID=3364939 RepID=UPI0036FD747A